MAVVHTTRHLQVTPTVAFLAPRPRGLQPVVAKQHAKLVSKDVEASIKKRLLRRPLTYSRHAQRRLEDRSVSEEDILDVLHNGVINKNVSKFGGERSPLYAIEKKLEPQPGQPQQLLRVLFAQAEWATLVVTAVYKPVRG